MPAPMLARLELLRPDPELKDELKHSAKGGHLMSIGSSVLVLAQLALDTVQRKAVDVEIRGRGA